ncbi:MAG: type II secretion system GspH family protein [Planctomycetes bacterium]|nr:type II secretion system GspH family protein [Planctomycetota bacterium]
MRSSRGARAFTLIEVLVVASIVSLLVALTMGGLGSAMAASRSSRCSNNLRQFGVAAEAYASTYHDSFPAAVIYFQQGDSVRTVGWDFESNGGGATKPGSLALFVDQALDALRCPDYEPVPGREPLTGYHYNTSFIGHEGFYPELGSDGRMHDGWSRVRLGLNATQRRRTDTVAVFADGGFRGGTNRFMRAPGNTVESDAGLIHAGTSAFRHRGCCNACFLDGHGATFGDPCRSALSTADLLKYVVDFPRNGFLSGDDSAYDPR